MTNTEKLAALGRLLYGDRWQAPMARALGVTAKTISNYVSGETSPARITSRLLYVLEGEKNKLQAAVDLVNSDKISCDEMTAEKIKQIVGRYEFLDPQHKLLAINEINKAIFDENWLSDFEEIARKWSKK